MSKYSSDSGSSGSQRRYRSRKRSSSGSSVDRRKHSSRHSKSKSSYHQSSSRSAKHRRRRSHSRSSRRSRSSSRGKDRGRYKRRSRSRDYSRSSKCIKSRSRRRSSSSSSSTSSSASSASRSNSKKAIVPQNPTSSSAEELREKLLQAIKAAESADSQLKKQGVLPPNVKSRNDITTLAPIKPDVEAVLEIDADGFVPKSFKSFKGKASNEEKARKTPDVKVEKKDGESEKSLFHSSLFDEPKKKMDRWVKKLFQIRQRALQGESPS